MPPSSRPNREPTSPVVPPAPTGTNRTSACPTIIPATTQRSARVRLIGHRIHARAVVVGAGWRRRSQIDPVMDDALRCLRVDRVGAHLRVRCRGPSIRGAIIAQGGHSRFRHAKCTHQQGWPMFKLIAPRDLGPIPATATTAFVALAIFAWTERSVLVDPEGLSVPYWPWKLW